MTRNVQNLVNRAEVLMEALPYIQRFHGATFVIKYGGHAMESAELKASFARDIVMLNLIGIKPVVVHGGGPQISELLERMGVKSRFVRGLRVTDENSIGLVEMALQRINQEIVALIARQGAKAVGLSGKDGGLMRARKLRLAPGVRTDQDSGPVDVGLVGEVVEVDPTVLHTLHQANFIPVVAPVGYGRDGLTYNINADSAAGKLAAALKAEKLILMTDVEGIKDQTGALISTLAGARARKLIARGVISAGMIPKVECCIEALRAGVQKTHIIDGRQRHAVLLEILTRHGVGTEVIGEPSRVLRRPGAGARRAQAHGRRAALGPPSGEDGVSNGQAREDDDD
jgi:acetylglutamate kinase